MASYDVVEVYTDITDGTLHCRVLSYECEMSQQVHARQICAVKFTCYTLASVVWKCSSARQFSMDYFSLS